jgi:tetratricopeptide (TPR) repeat protein
MSASRPVQERRLLPRWQPSAETVLQGELRPLAAAKSRTIDDEHFEARKAEWEVTRSLEVAAELIASAIVLGRTEEVIPAARLLAEDTSDVSVTLREMARGALNTTPGAIVDRPHQRGHLVRTAIYTQISQIRHHLRSNPRDAYAWVDLGRLYTILGQFDPARKAINTAQAIAPEDRFVLRAGARFFVHAGEAEVAQRMLNKADATRHDPWLMAAEIAVSQVLERSPRTASLAARALKEDQWSPRSSSELAGSFATLLMQEGVAQKARGFFRRSLRDPTENALAQAQWAAGNTTGLVIPPQLMRDPNGHEARALRDTFLGNWDSALNHCWEWAEYEPTSSRSMQLGSYIASVAREDSETILEFTERGLAAEPRNATLLNNKAVGLVYAGRIPEALKILHRVVIEKERDIEQPALYATTGLVFFRSGDTESGRLYYEKAVSHPYSHRDRRCHALALWHFAREEVRINSERIDATIARAEKASKDMELAELDVLRQRVLELAKKPIKANRRTKIFPVS